MIVAYAVSTTKTAAETSRLVRDARATLGIDRPEPAIIADDGGENLATHADVAMALAETGSTMLIAGVDLLCSNSMIERFWSSMKHRFLYTQRLDSLAALRRFVDFLVEQHNDVIPHSAFDGQTPAEVFVGAANELPRALAHLRQKARVQRIEHNRRMACRSRPTQPPADSHVP